MGPPFSFFTARHRGHTLVELVVVMVLLGIIATFAAPRFFGRSDFDARGFFEAAIQTTRYAQKLAQASGCDIRVTFSAGGVSLHQWVNGGTCAANACGGSGLTPVQHPGGGELGEAAPQGIAVGSAQFCFDPIGRPRNAGGLLSGQVNVSIGGRTLTVEPDTGYTRCTAGC